MNEELTALENAIKNGKRKDAKATTESLINSGVSAQEILDALIHGMDDVGRRFRANEIFVPEVLVAARAMNTAMSLLEPEMVKAGLKPKYTVVIGTVEGDLHDIGKNLVAMMLKGANFRIIDLGTNVSPDAFIQAVRENEAQIVALSSLLTTTMPSMKATVEQFRAEAELDTIKIMVGGAPITQAFADEIKADGYADDAAGAVDVARQLVSA